MIDTESLLDQLAVRSGQLYSLPGVAMQVLQLTRNPQVDTKALKQCIENDPAIAGRILRVVNSSLFGLSREVADLGQALAMLGTMPLKLLVLGFSLPSGLFLDLESKMLVWYWKHALTKAVAARELSNRLWRMPGDEAFLAGLFQDLGVLLLFQQLGQPYARLLDRAVTNRLDLCASERRALGFAHTELSTRLLEQWSFPEALCEAVAWQPGEEPNRLALTQILHLSELFARLFADGDTAALPELLESGKNYCHHVGEHLETLMLAVEEKVGELADIFSLALPDGLEYRDVLAEAQRQLAHVATRAAEDLVRSRVPEQAGVDEDWTLDELDSLSEALAAACTLPIEEEPKHERPRAAAAPALATPVPAAPAVPAAARAVRAPVASQAAPRSATLPRTASAHLLDRLTGAVAVCRPSRRSLSLLLVKLFAGEELLNECGPNDLATVRQVLGKVCARLDYPGVISLPYGELGFAMILPGAERVEAVELGNELIRTVRLLATSAGVARKEWLKVDVGVASIVQLPKNFPPRDLLAGADRCLYASHASGGGVVKSIEIY